MPKKINVQNLIAHCTKGTSDKVYIASIRVNPNGTFTVLGKWGRNGKLNLMCMEQCTVRSWVEAATEQASLFRSKLSKGYIDITCDGYRGGLTLGTPCISNNLEGPVEVKGGLNAYMDGKERLKQVSINGRIVNPVNVSKNRKVVREEEEELEDVGSTSGRRFDFDL